MRAYCVWLAEGAPGAGTRACSGVRLRRFIRVPSSPMISGREKLSHASDRTQGVRPYAVDERAAAPLRTLAGPAPTTVIIERGLWIGKIACSTLGPCLVEERSALVSDAGKDLRLGPSLLATPAAAAGGETVRLSAVPGKLAFNTKKLTAKAGTVTLSMSNPSTFSHGIAIEGNGVDKDGHVVLHGGTSTVTVKLEPGTYTFYCPVPGHRQAGMQGALAVT